MTITFQIIGLPRGAVPRGAGSKRAFPIRKAGQLTGKFVMTDSSGEAGKEWRSLVTTAAFNAMKDAGLAPFTEPLVLNVDFTLPRPKNHYGSGKNSAKLKVAAPTAHYSKPDATKLVRLLEDACTHIVWRDDAQICEQHITKLYGDCPGCTVTVASWAARVIPKASPLGLSLTM